MKTAASIKIATLRGPSAVEMVKMMADAVKGGDYDITVYDEPAEVLALMAGGKVDFAVLPSAAARVLQEKNIDYHIVATIIHGGLYVCGPDRDIARISDLKGRSINVLAGSTPPEMMLRHLIKAAGIKPGKDVLFDSSFPTHRALAEAAQSGTAELFILSEPFVSQTIKANGNFYILIDIGKEWEKMEGTLPSVASLFCKGQTAARHPETVKEITSALKHSCEWVKAHPGEAATLASDLGIFYDKEAVKASIPRSGFDVVV